MKKCRCCGNPLEMYGIADEWSKPLSLAEQMELREKYKNFDLVMISAYRFSATNLVCVRCLERGCKCYGKDLVNVL